MIAVEPPLGIPSVSRGTSAPPVSALLAPSGRSDALRNPGANFSGCFDAAFLDPIGNERGNRSPAPGRQPIKEACDRAFKEGETAGLHSSIFATGSDATRHRQTSASSPASMWTAPRRSQTRRSHNHEIDTAEQRAPAENEPRLAVNKSCDAGDPEPEQERQQSLGQRRPRQQNYEREAKAHQGEIFGELNDRQTPQPGGRNQRQPDHPDRAGQERPIAAIPTPRRRGLSRHLIAVEAITTEEDSPGMLSRIDAGRAAVLGAVIDAAVMMMPPAGPSVKVSGSNSAMVARPQARHDAEKSCEQAADEAPEHVCRAATRPQTAAAIRMRFPLLKSNIWSESEEAGGEVDAERHRKARWNASAVTTAVCLRSARRAGTPRHDKERQHAKLSYEAERRHQNNR